MRWRKVFVGFKDNNKIDLFYDKETQSLNVVTMESIILPRNGMRLLGDIYVSTSHLVMGIIQNHIHYTTIENNFILPNFSGFLTDPVFYSLVYEYEGAMLDKTIGEGEIIASICFVPLGVFRSHIYRIANNHSSHLEDKISIEFIEPPEDKNKFKQKSRIYFVSNKFKKSYDDIKKVIETNDERKLEEAKERIKEDIRKNIKPKDEIPISDIPEEVINKFVEFIFNEKEYLTSFRAPHPLATWHPGTIYFTYTIYKFSNKKEAEEMIKKNDRQTFWVSSFRAILIEHNKDYYVGLVEDRGRD